MQTSSDGARSVAIQAEGLGKQYSTLDGRRHDTFREILSSAFSSVLPRKRQRRAAPTTFWALHDVSFQIGQGERVGILGLNGAGKSTLLKVLSRVTAPTTGEAWLHGRLGSLLEVGTGFHSELTGRENTYLYGAILGMGKAEIDRKFDAIVAFADIEPFIDMPVKRYSSGMYVRLAFSVAAHLEPDILLLDEVLAVGDLPFQRKCIEFAKDLRKRNATVLLVSHNMFSIKSLCDRVIYLRQGCVAFDGATEAGIALYEADCRLGGVGWATNDGAEWPVVITDCALMGEDGRPKTLFRNGERMRFRFDYEVVGPVVEPGFVVSILRSDGVACCCFSTELDHAPVDPACRSGRIELVTPPLPLVAESYRIEILAREGGFQRLLCAQGGGAFHIRDSVLDLHFGVFHQAGEWRFDDESTRDERPKASAASAH